jgi:hypothetical protein
VQRFFSEGMAWHESACSQGGVLPCLTGNVRTRFLLLAGTVLPSFVESDGSAVASHGVQRMDVDTAYRLLLSRRLSRLSL